MINQHAHDVTQDYIYFYLKQMTKGDLRHEYGTSNILKSLNSKNTNEKIRHKNT